LVAIPAPLCNPFQAATDKTSLGRTGLNGNEAADAGGGGGWIKTNRGVAACIAAVALALLAYLALSEWTWRELRDGFRLGFFTAVAVFAMLICAIAMMVDSRRNERDPDIARLQGRDWIVAVIALVACYAFFELAWQIDFLLITPVFLTAGTWLLGVRPLRSAIVAAVLITVVVFGLFWVIGIDLPTNVIGL
jgi:cobalamin synthase